MNYKDILKNNPFTVAMILLATLVSAVTFTYSPVIAVFELVIIIVTSVFALKWLSKVSKRKKEYLDNFEKYLRENDEIGEITAAFPLPFAIVSNNGAIEWFNKSFHAVIDENSSCNDIFELIPTAKRFLVDNNFSSFDFINKEKKFTVFPSRMHKDSVILMFVDDSDLKDIRTEYNLSRPAVLIISIDSLEQTEENLDNAGYYSVVSEIERIISKWLFDNNCLFRKTAEGKFFAVTESSNLELLIKDRFSILDRIREYRFNDNEMDITLSIGVGKEKYLFECEASAKEALDLARGRGGDQAAVKIGDKYEFFGGLTGRKEKRGKIKSRNVSSALNEIIENSSDVFICGHSYSDFDAIGACIGISAIVHSCMKKAYIVVNMQTTLAKPLIKYVKKADNGVSFISPQEAEKIFCENSLLVITDTMRSHLVEAQELLKKSTKTVLIDHHRKTPDYIADNILEFHEPYASSACEMVTELVQYAPSKTKLMPAEAEALLSGIILDTKNYTLRVGVRTFEAAAYLKDCKADTVAVKMLFSASPEENVLISKLISSAKFEDNYAVAYSENEPGVSRLITSKTADDLLNIAGVDAAFVVTVVGDTVYVSARSLGKVNVQIIMEKFGGGGHQSMAACQIKDMKPDDVLEELHRYMKEYIRQL